MDHNGKENTLLLFPAKEYYEILVQTQQVSGALGDTRQSCCAPCLYQHVKKTSSWPVPN